MLEINIYRFLKCVCVCVGVHMCVWKVKVQWCFTLNLSSCNCSSRCGRVVDMEIPEAANVKMEPLQWSTRHDVPLSAPLTGHVCSWQAMTGPTSAAAHAVVGCSQLPVLPGWHMPGSPWNVPMPGRAAHTPQAGQHCLCSSARTLWAVGTVGRRHQFRAQQQQKDEMSQKIYPQINSTSKILQDLAQPLI